MARTKASVGAKISSGKSSKARCTVAPPTSSNTSAGSSDRSSRSAGGGNSVCPRETPKWQKPITNFFICREKGGDSDEETERNESQDKSEAGSSKPKSKKNVIESDEEEEEQRPTNTELEETIELEPLTGDDSHKIEEYYTKNSKGKGVGKKTKGKENVNGNVERRNSKRDLEEITFGEESPHVNKKVKVH